MASTSCSAARGAATATLAGRALGRALAGRTLALAFGLARARGGLFFSMRRGGCFLAIRKSYHVRRIENMEADSQLSADVFELERLAVDAAVGRRDPAGDLAGLGHRLH